MIFCANDPTTHHSAQQIMPSGTKFGLSGTDLIHGDDQKTVAGTEVAPSISVTTSNSSLATAADIH